MRTVAATSRAWDESGSESAVAVWSEVTLLMVMLSGRKTTRRPTHTAITTHLDLGPETALEMSPITA